MDKNEITLLLEQLSEGDSNVVNNLMPLVYGELRDLAGRQLRSERAGHTLGATALVHEAYLRLVDQRNVSWQNRAHFFAIAAQAMRRILINYATQRAAHKRGGGQALVTLDDADVPGEGRETRAEELIELDQALSRLADLNERQARIVEYRFFAGLKHEEIAEVLGVSEPTVRRDWRLARAWLSKELG